MVLRHSESFKVLVAVILQTDFVLVYMISLNWQKFGGGGGGGGS